VQVCCFRLIVMWYCSLSLELPTLRWVHCTHLELLPFLQAPLIGYLFCLRIKFPVLMQAFFRYFVHAREEVCARFQITNPSSAIVNIDPCLAKGAEEGNGHSRATTTARKKVNAPETPAQKQRRMLTSLLASAAAMNTKYIVRVLRSFVLVFLFCNSRLTICYTDNVPRACPCTFRLFLRVYLHVDICRNRPSFTPARSTRM
jgi:hypothetical protein